MRKIKDMNMKVYKLTFGTNKWDNSGLMIFSTLQKVIEYLDILIARKIIDKWQKTQILQNGFSDTLRTPGVCGVCLDTITMDCMS